MIPESLACRLYVLTVVFETIIDLVIEGELLLRIRQENKNASEISSRKMPVYLSIFALAQFVSYRSFLRRWFFFDHEQLIPASHGHRCRIRSEHPPIPLSNVSGLPHATEHPSFPKSRLFNALFLVYAIIQIGEIRQALSSTTAVAGEGISSIPINVLTTIIPIVISVAEIAYIALGWKIYHEFGWKVYKFLGADRRIKKMYANYQIYECLIKFDVFFWVGFSVQFIWLVLQKSDWEYYVTCVALPLSVVVLVEGHLAARHENKWMMITFMSGCIGAMVYFIYKVSVIHILKVELFQFFITAHQGLDKRAGYSIQACLENSYRLL